MVNCITHGCKNGDKEQRKGKNFYRVPKRELGGDNILRKAWFTRLEISNVWASFDNLFVCEDHFKSDDFEDVDLETSSIPKSIKKQLKATAVPSSPRNTKPIYDIRQSAKKRRAEAQEKQLIDEVERTYVLRPPKPEPDIELLTSEKEDDETIKFTNTCCNACTLPTKKKRIKTEEQFDLETIPPRPIVKPPYKYADLISMAIRQSANKKLKAYEIFEWIASTFPYYAGGKGKMKEKRKKGFLSVLKSNKKFIQLPPSPEQSKRGIRSYYSMYWTLVEPPPMFSASTDCNSTPGPRTCFPSTCTFRAKPRGSFSGVTIQDRQRNKDILEPRLTFSANTDCNNAPGPRTCFPSTCTCRPKPQAHKWQHGDAAGKDHPTSDIQTEEVAIKEEPPIFPTNTDCNSAPGPRTSLPSTCTFRPKPQAQKGQHGVLHKSLKETPGRSNTLTIKSYLEGTTSLSKASTAIHFPEPNGKPHALLKCKCVLCANKRSALIKQIFYKDEDGKDHLVRDDFTPKIQTEEIAIKEEPIEYDADNYIKTEEEDLEVKEPVSVYIKTEDESEESEKEEFNMAELVDVFIKTEEDIT